MSFTCLSPSFRKHAARAATFSVAACSAATVFALQPLITDDTGTQGAGGNQLEFSLTRDRAKVAGDTERTHSLDGTYTRGVSETVDVFAGVGYSRIRASGPGGDASGLGNPSLGLKWRFFDNADSGTSLAVKPEVLFPVSSSRESEGLGTGKTSGNLTLILSQELPFGALHVNLGTGRERFRDTASNPNTTTHRASLAPVWNVSEGWILAADFGLESARSAGSRVNTKYAELAAIHSLNKDVDLAFGLMRARDDEHPRTTTNTATAGVTWRF